MKLFGKCEVNGELKFRVEWINVLCIEKLYMDHYVAGWVNANFNLWCLYISSKKLLLHPPLTSLNVTGWVYLLGTINYYYLSTMISNISRLLILISRLILSILIIDTENYWGCWDFRPVFFPFFVLFVRKGTVPYELISSFNFQISCKLQLNRLSFQRERERERDRRRHFLWA